MGCIVLDRAMFIPRELVSRGILRFISPVRYCAYHNPAEKQVPKSMGISADLLSKAHGKLGRAQGKMRLEFRTIMMSRDMDKIDLKVLIGLYQTIVGWLGLFRQHSWTFTSSYDQYIYLPKETGYWCLSIGWYM